MALGPRDTDVPHPLHFCENTRRPGAGIQR